MRTVSKQIVWPVRGVERISAYHDAVPDETRAYAAPFSMNVRGRGPLERRMRGGSRPGLRVVEGVSASANGSWAWSNGEKILWPDGTPMAFTPNSELLAPDGTRIIDLHAVPNAASSIGDAPKGATIATLYRARLFAAIGSDWFCSRIGDTADWDYGADKDDAARACAGNVALAGRKGDGITAFMPVDDKYLYIGTSRSLWCLSGDPCGGNLSCVSPDIGVSGAAAWCRWGGRLYFLSGRGFVSVAPGEAPTVLSAAIPNLVGDADSIMGFDPYDNAVYAVAGDETWCVELDGSRSAFWPISFEYDEQPTKIARMTVNGRDCVAFLCRDGKWRVFDEDAPCSRRSYVALGPFRVSSSDDLNGVLAELHVTTAEGSSDLMATVFTAHTAERAVKFARMGTSPVPSFVFKAGWNAVWRPRVRGAWCVVVLDCPSGKWAFEAVRAICRIAGRLRP